MNNRKSLLDISVRVRQNVLNMAYYARSAHTGGSLSCVDILSALYFEVMKVFPERPDHPDRDRLIFSKAHDCKALFAVLSERGYFPRKRLEAYEKDGGLPGHATRTALPGVEISAGSLGHGLSIAAGMAFAGRIDRKKFRVFTLLSDGECDEGATWEAALFAGHHKLSNLISVVDYNKIQSYGRTADILDLEPFADKWRAFGWEVREAEGHSPDAVADALSHIPFVKDKPSVLLAHTVKGYGGPAQHIDKVSSHYKPPTENEFKELLKKENI